jgi:hypothetical protein
MLQLNNGNGTFSEIGQLAGIHQTEWSWSPLFADFDNDGLRDVVITNGFPKDITDKDFGNFRSGPGGNIASIEYLLDSIPAVKVSNYIFRNNGDLTFTDVTKAWGMSHPAFSNGASFADFDNDGDLDYIVNNINDEVLFYENTLYSGEKKNTDTLPHYLRVELKGPAGNTAGLGAKILVRYGEKKLSYHDHSVYRGYISTVEDIVHFGLGHETIIDTIEVKWPDGKITFLAGVKADQTLVLDHKDAKEQSTPQKGIGAEPTLLKNITASARLNFVHQEDDKIDFNAQRTIPHKFSQAGPGIASGDINGDGLDDFYIGGAAGKNGTLFFQNRNGSFTGKELKKSTTGLEEDAGALFFDADTDGDLDLYVVSGTFEYAKDAVQHQDRLYINQGKGQFVLNEAALPATVSSGSCARAADIDNDGDLDLFVAGRVVPWQYPLPAESYILVNDKGKFSNQIQAWCPELELPGMITDAVWTDYNNDGKVDLITVGEFMSVTVYKNDGSRLKKLTDSGLEKFSGWWNSITGSDFDHDGDIDYVSGNLGMNNYYKASASAPLRVYAKDIDGNNSVDAILTCYLRSEEGVMQEYPVHFWDELNSQSPKFRRKFNYYKKFGRTTMDKMLSAEERKDALVLETNYTSSAYIENLGNDKFSVRALPIQAQVAPINGMVVGDFNHDGHTDVMTVGNDYGNEVFTGRYDAYSGLILLGDGGGNFSVVSPATSGFTVNGDGKGLTKLLHADGSEMFVATQNRDSIKIFTYSRSSRNRVFKPEALDVAADLMFENGSKQRVEFYYGSGYLSQSVRSIVIPEAVKEIVVYDSRGESRPVAATTL